MTTDEFYHKDIFGTVVDVSLSDAEGLDINADSQDPALRSRSEFNIFALTDALGARKKKEAWILYQKALAAGMSAEEVFFKLFWQVKSMLIALKTRSVEETDMKAFPYAKAKGFLKNFKPGELENLSEGLVLGYYQARRGKGEIETLVEKILLSL